MKTLTKSTDQRAMDAWGEMSGDLNPLHCDPEYAADSRYGGTIMHGHMTVTWLVEWAKDNFGDRWLERGAIRSLRYRRPLRPGVEYRIGPDADLDGEGGLGLAVHEPDGTVAVTCVVSNGDE